jgi:hypothetical protein
VDGLFGDAETAGDVLPGPAEFSSSLDLEEFQSFGERAKGGNCTQADVGVLTCGAFCDLESRFHVRQHMLTELRRQHMLTRRPA